MTIPIEIRLECEWEPSWIDAQTRLAMAAEILKIPFYIVTDEVAYAYKDFESMAAHADLSRLSRLAAQGWWDQHAKQVNSIDEARRVLYPWFHEGEEFPQ